MVYTVNYMTIQQIRKLRGQKKTYKEIGIILGVSKQRVHQIHKSYKPTEDYIKIKVKVRDGNKCTECGALKTLEVHHIDGVKTNNKLDNLKTLCRKCHNKTKYGKKKDIVVPLRRVAKTCPTCSKNFEYPPSVKRIYCSQKCCFETKRVHFTCLVCDKKRTLPRAIFNRQGGKYCSIRCFFKIHKKYRNLKEGQIVYQKKSQEKFKQRYRNDKEFAEKTRKKWRDYYRLKVEKKLKS